MPMCEDVLISSGDVARMLGVSKSYVRTLETKRLLVPARKLPTGRRLYREIDVAEFIRGIEVKVGSELKENEG